MPAGDLGLPGLATVQGAALGEQSGAGSTVDRAVHAAAAQQRAVRRVDDGLHLEPGDVAFDDFDPAHRPLPECARL